MKVAIYIDTEDLAIGIKTVLKMNSITSQIIYEHNNINFNDYDILIISDDKFDKTDFNYSNRCTVLLITNNINPQHTNYIKRPFTSDILMDKINTLSHLDIK